MRKMDEMERSIQLHAEERGYRTALLSLSAWALFNCWKALAHGSEYSPLPALVLCLAVCVQGFSQMSMKRRMVVGDEEYREPNKLLRTVVAAIVVTVLVLSIGTYLLARA
ncbi:hypothetical protein [Collinsella aerofaciens]|uniref:hypothetical protein n=1 Tax=Collinsella aerofaciens TaxID=74426 RepID=UPI003566E171